MRRGRLPEHWVVTLLSAATLTVLVLPAWPSSSWPLLPSVSVASAAAQVMIGAPTGLWHAVGIALLEGAWGGTGAQPLASALLAWLGALFVLRFFPPDSRLGRLSAALCAAVFSELALIRIAGPLAERWTTPGALGARWLLVTLLILALVSTARRKQHRVQLGGVL